MSNKLDHSALYKSTSHHETSVYFCTLDLRRYETVLLLNRQTFISVSSMGLNKPFYLVFCQEVLYFYTLVANRRTRQDFSRRSMSLRACCRFSSTRCCCYLKRSAQNWWSACHQFRGHLLSGRSISLEAIWMSASNPHLLCTHLIKTEPSHGLDGVCEHGLNCDISWWEQTKLFHFFIN